MWSRRGQPSTDVRRAVPLSGTDRRLAAAELSDGRWAFATTGSLAVVATDGASPRLALRRPWADVDRAAFDPHRSLLTVTWVDGAGDLELHLLDPTRTAFAQVLRERVEWSVVLAEGVDVAGGRVRVAVRRDLDGTLYSQVVAGEGVDLSDPRVTDVVDATETAVRRACGLA